ncbi:hypothetical protein DsansV1_C03g0028401 [Dioscorea sansibarensis]
MGDIASSATTSDAISTHLLFSSPEKEKPHLSPDHERHGRQHEGKSEAVFFSSSTPRLRKPRGFVPFFKSKLCRDGGVDGAMYILILMLEKDTIPGKFSFNVLIDELERPGRALDA